jgi:hypothetical protein
VRLCDGETEKGQCDGDFGDDTGENIGCLAKPPPLLNLLDTETGWEGEPCPGEKTYKHGGFLLMFCELEEFMPETVTCPGYTT